MIKRVLLIATVQSHIGQFHKPLMKMLKENGWEIHVAARDNLAEKNGLQLEYPDKVFDVPFQRSPFDKRNIGAYKEIKRILEQNHYDVIHCNTPVGGIVGRLAGNKYRKTGTQVFYTAHGFHFYKGAPKKNWLLYYPIEKWMADHFTDKLITINYEDYHFARERFRCAVYHIHGAGVSEKRFFTIPSEQKNELRRRIGIEPSDIAILCVGELLPNKNQIMLIKAVQGLSRYYSNIKVLIAGNGPQHDTLDSYIRKNKLTSVIRLLGYCSNIETYQKASDIAVSCSIREGLGFNVIEAMLCGNPVIATLNRGHRELINDGVNGFLVKIGDIDCLADRLEKLFINPELRHKLQESGKMTANLYGQNNVERELTHIYYEE